MRPLGKRLAPKSVRNVHVALSNALSLAVSDGYIARNVAKAREVAPTARSREMQVWTPEQIRAFLTFVVDDRLYALWRLAATTGLLACAGGPRINPSREAPLPRVGGLGAG